MRQGAWTRISRTADIASLWASLPEFVRNLITGTLWTGVTLLVTYVWSFFSHLPFEDLIARAAVILVCIAGTAAALAYVRRSFLRETPLNGSGETSVSVSGGVTPEDAGISPGPQQFYYRGCCWDIMPAFYNEVLENENPSASTLDFIIKGPFCPKCQNPLRREVQHGWLANGGVSSVLEDPCQQCGTRFWNTLKPDAIKAFREATKEVYREARRLIRIGAPLPAGPSHDQATGSADAARIAPAFGSSYQPLPRLRRLDEAQRLRRLEHLRLLHDIGTHVLLNPATVDPARFAQLRDWWEDRVVSESEHASASPQALSRFETLADVSDRGYISDKLQALRAILDEVQSSIERYVDSVKERLSAFRDTVVSAVDVDHATKRVSIAMRDPNVSTEQNRVYVECKVEFLSLDYTVSGWPGDNLQ